MSTTEPVNVKNFIRNIIDKDLQTGRHNNIITRFPPEPNGYLHIGHAKSICINFGIARDYNGRCHLRFDDTNPVKEDIEYIESIKEDVRWLGFDWAEHEYYASDYYQKLYEYAVDLIKQGKAYVCSLSADEVREYRGTLTEPGKDSPYRNRTVEENLDLFEKMKNGEFEDGKHILRAKIDMASPNVNMRDPAIYRIKKAHHHRTGDQWCIYPMYDFAHCVSDAIEGITHSICTLEFEDHRPLYDWFLDQLDVPCHPQQIEFARLNLKSTVMSKRKLLELVQNNYVSGWDDPRMPTIAGMRRRGYPPEAIREFADIIGVGKSDSWIDLTVLEDCIRNYLNLHALRVMCVIDPVKLVITNFPEDSTEEIEAPFMPEDFSSGSRNLPFGREIYIEREDFMENPPSKFYRLSPGKEVRLRYSYYIKCESVVKDASGEIKEIHCTYDPQTRGGSSPDGRKVKATIHWVSAKHSKQIKVKLYERLFSVENPDSGDKDYREYLNNDSLKILDNCWIEPCMINAEMDKRYQFERLGYFTLDRADSRPDSLVFNRIVTLRDSWAKVKNT